MEVSTSDNLRMENETDKVSTLFRRTLRSKNTKERGRRTDRTDKERRRFGTENDLSDRSSIGQCPDREKCSRRTECPFRKDSGRRTNLLVNFVKKKQFGGKTLERVDVKFWVGGVV